MARSGILLSGVADRDIRDHTRKRLWHAGGDRCAFPGCEQLLVEDTRDRAEATIVGIECHIVAQRDSPNVARSPGLLTDEERRTYASLIEHRHAFDNLVLMCGVHSMIIDDPAQEYSVAEVLEMKRGHEETISRERREAVARRAAGVPQDEAPRAEGTPMRMLLLDDVPFWQRKAVRRLGEVEPGTLAWLEAEIGNPAEPGADRVVDLLRRWPPRLAEGSTDLLYAVVRIAEGSGRWDVAADVWERLAAREHHRRADHLVRAAIDAGVGGDAVRRERLLVEAEREDPDSPRLRLERLDDRQAPEARLEVLGGVHSDDPPLASLIAAQRAIAALQLPDLEQAEHHLAEARELEPDSLHVRSVSVNLRVQRARIAVRDDRDFALEEARAAMLEALDLRDTMVAMGRWEESGRLLMLAADVPAVLRDPASAQRLLERGRPEELEVTDGAEVLGDAALRADADELALRFTDDVDPTDGVRRIRAAAHVGQPGQREQALATLRELALGDGPEAELAAFERLSACLPPVRAAWDEDVAAVLAGGRHDRVATGLRIMSLAASGDVMRAEELASALPREPWAAELRLRVAGVRGNHQLLERTGQEFLDFRPDASGRLLAAMGLARAGRLDRASDVLGGVAHDLNAPPMVRTDAFAALLRTLADRDAWEQASREWQSWQQLSHSQLDRPDDRVSAWQVRIVHHATRRP